MGIWIAYGTLAILLIATKVGSARRQEMAPEQKINKLEEMLLLGKINERTYERLRRKYQDTLSGREESTAKKRKPTVKRKTRK